MSSWNSFADIEKDMFAYSDFSDGGFAAAPPKSIAEYKARTMHAKSSIYNDTNDIGVGVVISGRGKYVADRVYRPGDDFKSIDEDEAKVRSKLRETVGLGYTNELIKRSLLTEDTNEEIQFEPKLKLGLTSSSNASSASETLPEVQKELEDFPELQETTRRKKNRKKK